MCQGGGMSTEWDCVVVGGGAAGMSAALVLGRARRKTLVVDAGEQSNLAAGGIGGLLGHDTRPPAELYADGRAELEAYPAVELRAGSVVAGERVGEGFTVELADGATEAAGHVLLATGMDYRYPDLPGAVERWGHSVFHCPFCHGWEVSGKPLGVLEADEMGVERALMLTAWSDDVTMFANGPAELEPDVAERLERAGIPIDERRISGLRGPGADLEAVTFEDGDEVALGGLLVPVRLHQRSDLPVRLGAAIAEPNPLAADALEVDGMRRAGPGLFAAGDVLAQAPSVAAAIATGSLAGAMIVKELTG